MILKIENEKKIIQILNTQIPFIKFVFILFISNTVLLVNKYEHSFKNMRSNIQAGVIYTPYNDLYCVECY